MKVFLKNKPLFFVLVFTIFLVGFYLGFLKGSYKTTCSIQTNPLLTYGIIYELKSEGVNKDLFSKVWKMIEDRYVKEEISAKKLYYGAIKGLVRALDDPYSYFFTPQEAEQFNKGLKGTFEGIGAEIGIRDNTLTIITPLPNSPAEKAGLMPGDKILMINGKETTNITLEEAVHKIRGPKGSKVKFLILSKGAREPKEVEVLRDKIVIPGALLENKSGFAYIKIYQFNENTVKDFRKIVNKILKSNYKGIILDLRWNPGGYLDSALKISDYWIEKGKLIVKSKKAYGKEEIFNASRYPVLKNYKTVILVNQGSASASEIIAGALQDYKLATIIGEKTFGKGSVQDYIILEDSSALKLTTALWITPNGRIINGKGIEPDIEVKVEEYKKAEDIQLKKAIDYLMNK